MEEILRRKKVRATPFRLAVLNIIEGHRAALCVSQIEKELEGCDRVTLYRTIKTFTDNGVVHEIALPGMEKKIALCREDCHTELQEHTHQHAHFKCRICLKVFCKTVAEFPSIKLKSFKVEGVEINLVGVCQECH